MNLPEYMTVCEITEFGNPEVLKTTLRPISSPAAGEVLIKIIAVGVNRPDVMQRKGLYSVPPGASDMPGLEIAGTVVALGEGVNQILDIVVGDYISKNLKCLANERRLVQIAIQNRPKSEINLLPVMFKRLTITGSTLRAGSVNFKTEIAKKLRKHVWPLLTSSQHIGKIVLEVA